MTNAVNHASPPKGYRVKVVPVKAAGGELMFDCQVFKTNDSSFLIISSSGTCFEFKADARKIGIRRAWDIYNGATSWS